MAESINPMRKHASLIGEVTIASNDAHYLVFQAFERVSGLSHKMADALFYSLRSDASQRELLLAAASVRFAADKPRLTELRGIINRLNGAAGARNEAVHTSWGISVTRVPETAKYRVGGVVKRRRHKDDGQFTDRFEKVRQILRSEKEALHAWLAALPKTSS